MTATTSPTASGVGAVDERIAAFAAAVRAELADLSPDEVNDLADGLEADLAEQAAESGDDFALPDPVAYAAELRAAAGLPARDDGKRPRPPVGERLRAWRARTAASMRASRFGAWMLDTLLVLRPVWWIARGWALYTLINAYTGVGGYTFGFPENPLGWLLLLALVVLSIQWGRGLWAPVPWLRVVRVIVSTITAIALLPLLLTVGSLGTRTVYVGEPAYSHPGLVLDGERVRNVFAYDAEGNPLPAVQLFDQDGRPLTTVHSDSQEPWDDFFYGGPGPVPVSWNVPGRSPCGMSSRCRRSRRGSSPEDRPTCGARSRPPSRSRRSPRSPAW